MGSVASEHDPVTGWEREYADYVAARCGALRTTAYLLCGNWHEAEDLAQTALTKLFLAWRRIDRDGNPDAYARRILVRSFLDERRRGWRRERATGSVPDVAAPPEPTDERMLLLAALAGLPTVQRAAVVLRYSEVRSIAETAGILAVSEGSVKSACSRGLLALREVLEGSNR